MDEIVYYYPEGHQAHFERGHPERPERVEVMREALCQQALWEKYPCLPPVEVSEGLLKSVHSDAYLSYLMEASRSGSHLDADTYTTPASWNLALNTAGGAIAISSHIWKGLGKRGFALTRPPGHHAVRDMGMGFCLLNNVALAAEHLLRNEGTQRLAIIDLDLHHGNGTQDIFWERGDVFYISTHQYPLYPGSGMLEETGVGNGKGKTANFPLPPGSGDQAFYEITEKIILPLLIRYKPEMILVSFGFDPHWRDPLGHLLLSASGYGQVIRQLTDWADLHCQGRIALFLEGGYDLDAAKACCLAAVSTLIGKPWQDALGPSPRPEGGSWKLLLDRAMELWQI